MFSTIQRLSLALVISTAMNCAVATPGQATSAGSDSKLRRVLIYNNNGGQIVRFALRVGQVRANHQPVRIAGSCDSACTLFLGLPKSQMCITPGAKFRFHAPMAGNRSAAASARKYLMRKYPNWVRSFIASRGGLTRKLISMDYGYASRFIRTC